MSEPANHLEVRAIVDGEQEQFLAHMCDAFCLDAAAARPIFYNDTSFDLTQKRVLFDTSTNKIVSSLTIVPSAIRVSGGALIQVAGLAGVCTAPEFQRRGYAQRLIRATIQAAPAEFGYSVAALSTSQPEVYHSVGFEHCSSAINWTAHRELLPAFMEADYASEAALNNNSEILSEIKTLYEYSHASQPGAFIRSDNRWKTIASSNPPYSLVTWRSGLRLEGCIIYRMKEHRGDRVLEILDFIASTAAARRGLIGYLRTMVNVDLVSGQARNSDLRKLGIQDIPRFTSYRRDGIMFAIMDFDACLSAVAATGVMTPVIRRSESGLTIRLENSISTKDRKPLRLFSVSNERLGVAIGMAPADEMTGDWISVDTGAMAQLFFGYRSASKLRSQDRLWISSQNALALVDSLFPSFDSYLGQLDSF
jgi:predicted acetyltransferase